MDARARGSSSSASGWLHGPVPDLLFGCGLGYLATVPLLLWVAGWAGATVWPTAIASLLAVLVSGPHYGATLLRVYEKREDRRRYAVFAVHFTAGLLLAFVLAVYDPFLASVLLTLYVTWSPWHFAGQNYGLGLMFLRRRGIAVEPLAKRLFYASFLASYALAFLVTHMESSREVLAPGLAAGSASYRLLRLDVPLEWVAPLAALAAGAYLLSLAGAAALLLRRASLRDLVPAALLVLMQALWFAIPGFLHASSRFTLAGLPFAAIWISTAHAVQYLWVTSYYSKRGDPSFRALPYLTRALLAGAAVTVLPGLLLAPRFFGALPWDAGLGVLVFSVVNLHHFVLDGAIWKLRDGRVARVLLRGAEEPPAAPGAATGPGPLRRGVWAVGAVCLAVPLFVLWQAEIGYRLSGSDVMRAKRSLDRLRWVGRDSAPLRAAVGSRFAMRGEPERAMAEFRRSLELAPSALAWSALGVLHGKASRWEEALAAHGAALELDPEHPTALFQSVRALHRLEAGQGNGSGERAAALLARLMQVSPAHLRGARELARESAAEGQLGEAVAILEAARARAAPAERAALEAELRALRRPASP